MTSAFGSYYTHRPSLVKILLMLLCNCCAKIAPKKRTHNTNSTGMSVNLVVCACGFILIRSRKGQGSAYAAHQCSSWRWNLISSMRMQTVKKTFVGASIARPCPFACEKDLPRKALLRQVGGRPMVAPTYSMRLPIRYKTVTYRCRTCNPVLRVL